MPRFLCIFTRIIQLNKCKILRVKYLMQLCCLYSIQYLITVVAGLLFYQGLYTCPVQMYRVPTRLTAALSQARVSFIILHGRFWETLYNGVLYCIHYHLQHVFLKLHFKLKLHIKLLILLLLCNIMFSYAYTQATQAFQD